MKSSFDVSESNSDASGPFTTSQSAEACRPGRSFSPEVAQLNLALKLRLSDSKTLALSVTLRLLTFSLLRFLILKWYLQSPGPVDFQTVFLEALDFCGKDQSSPGKGLVEAERAELMCLLEHGPCFS